LVVKVRHWVRPGFGLVGVAVLRAPVRRVEQFSAWKRPQETTMRRGRSTVSRVIGFLLIGIIAVGAELPVFADAINLAVSKGPGPNDVSLGWTGGTAPYRVFRSPSSPSLLDAPNLLATTGATTRVDTPPPASITY
jgi:hypothetical protein